MWAIRAAGIPRKYRFFRHKWAVEDSNLRSLLTTDLQSVPFGHLGNRPGIRLLSVSTCNANRLPCRADDENRTRNLPLTRRVLCRLSYVGTPHCVAASSTPI